MHVYKNHAEGTNAPAFSEIVGCNTTSGQIEEVAKKNLLFFQAALLKKYSKKN